MTRANPFPNLININKTSEKTEKYNCIAWAFGENHRWWWPSPRTYWPDGLLKDSCLESFKELFKKAGFEVTESADIEDGYIRIALYMLDGEPTHASRQLKNGMWTSKLGPDIDISHELNDLKGPQYGEVGYIYRKRIK